MSKQSVKKITVPKTAQATLPFFEIYETGLLHVGTPAAPRYAIVGSMSNTDYQLLQDKLQRQKAEAYVSLFNSLPLDISWQEIYRTIDVDIEGLRDTLLPPSLPQNTQFEKDYLSVQSEFVDRAQTNISDNRLYFILSYSPKNKLDNVQNILTSYFTLIRDRLMELEVTAELLGPQEVLELFHDIYNPFEHGNFRLPADMYLKGNNIRDYIAPPHFEFRFRSMEMGASISKVFFVKSYSKKLEDTFIRDLLDTRHRIVISKHVRHIDPSEAAASIEKRLKQLEEERQIRNQHNARNSTTYIPYQLKAEIESCHKTLEMIRDKEHLFEVGIYIMVSANNQDDLNDIASLVKSAAMRNRVVLQELAARLDDALVTISPVAINRLSSFTHTLTSSALSVLHPFSYRRQFAENGYLYGFNTDTLTPIVHNRKNSRNANCFILGQTGSGKSAFAKLEIVDTSMLARSDKIFMIDPEAEFVPLAEEMGKRAKIINLCAGTTTYLNPFDMLITKADENPVNDKIDLILSMMESFKRLPLTAQEISIISRCVIKVYDAFLLSHAPDDLPTFRDFYKILLEQPEDEARNLSLYLETYIFGNNRLFAEHSNMDISDANLVVFRLDKIGSFLKEPAMLFTLDLIWQQLLLGWQQGRYTWMYADEAQEFYRTEKGGEYFERVFARFRKYGGIATAITQGLSDVLDRPSARSMLQNSDMVILLQQAPENEAAAAKLYDLSDGLRKYITHPQPGEGILVIDRRPTPFTHLYPSNNEIYRAITTKVKDKWENNQNEEKA